jgi:hypothetical protein
MKIDRSAASYLHAARRDSVSAPDPAQPSHRVSSMVAHRPLKFSTSEHDDDFAAKRPSKDRKPKPTKSPEDAGFVPKVPKPPVTMPYSVNGYGTSNKGKGLYRPSNDQYHGSNRASRSSRTDNRGQPTAHRHAPEPAPFDYRVHSENLNMVETRGKTPNRMVSHERARQKAKKKAAAVKKANQQWTFDSIISEALVENEIAISLLELEHKYIDEIDKRIDGPNRFAKYKQMSREECIKTATERREYVRGMLIAQLQLYLLKRSTFVEDGRQHIHYCNFASTIHRFSGSFRSVDSPNPTASVQTPPSGDPVTPPSVLNPNATPFQPDTNNGNPSDGSEDNDPTTTRLNVPNSSVSSLISPIVRINNVYQSGVNRLDNLLSSSTFASVREAMDRASQHSLNSHPSPNITPNTDNSPTPLIVATSNLPLPPLTMPGPIVSFAPMNLPVNVQFAPQPPIASMPPPTVNISQPTTTIQSQSNTNAIAPQPSPISSQPTNVVPPNNTAIPPIAHVAPTRSTQTAPMATNAAPIAPLAQPVPIAVATTPTVPTGPTIPNAPSATSMPTQHSNRVRTVPTASVSTTQTRTQSMQQTTVNPPPTTASVPSPFTPASNAPITALPGGNDPGNDPNGDPDGSSYGSNSSDSSESDSDDSNYDRNGNLKRRKKKKKQRSTAKIVSELNKNASYAEFKPLEFHPDLEKRQASFLFFDANFVNFAVLRQSFAECLNFLPNLSLQKRNEPTPPSTISSCQKSPIRLPSCLKHT